jgi:hypothetical protein
MLTLVQRPLSSTYLNTKIKEDESNPLKILTKGKEMKMKLLVLVSLAALVLIAGPVNWSLAGHGYHGYGMSMSDISEMDGNQDGLITFEEFSAPHNENLKSAFKMLDANNDEVISKEEWEEFLKIHGVDTKSKS